MVGGKYYGTRTVYTALRDAGMRSPANDKFDIQHRPETHLHCPNVTLTRPLPLTFIYHSEERGDKGTSAQNGNKWDLLPFLAVANCRQLPSVVQPPSLLLFKCCSHQVLLFIPGWLFCYIHVNNTNTVQLLTLPCSRHQPPRTMGLRSKGMIV